MRKDRYPINSKKIGQKKRLSPSKICSFICDLYFVLLFTTETFLLLSQNKPSQQRPQRISTKRAYAPRQNPNPSPVKNFEMPLPSKDTEVLH